MGGGNHSFGREWHAFIVSPSVDGYHAVAKLEKAKQKLLPTHATESPRVEYLLRSLKRPRAGRNDPIDRNRPDSTVT